MNNEIADFYVAFTTAGIAELKQGLDDIDKKLDGIEDGFTSATHGTNEFLAGLGLLLAKLGIFGGVLATVAAGIKNAFDIGERTLDLNNMAAAAGVASEEIETLGIALQRYGGDTNVAGATYKKIRDLLTEYGQGKISENQREVMARYGFNIQPGMTPDEVLFTLQEAMYRRVQAGDIGGRNQIASAFGIDQSVMLFLSQSIQDVIAELKNAEDKLVLSGEANKQNALALQEAKEELKKSWDKVSQELIPVITDVLNMLGPILEALRPIAAFLSNLITDTFDLGKNLLALIKGDITTDEFLDNIRKQDGIYGDTVRGVEGAVQYINDAWTVQDATKSSKNIASGNYSMQDIANVSRYLSYAAKNGSLTYEQINAMSEQLKLAANELAYTNTPLNAAGNTVSTQNDNRTYNSSNVEVKVKVPGRPEYSAGVVRPGGDFVPSMPAAIATGVK